jgi:hypothetical protein
VEVGPAAAAGREAHGLGVLTRAEEHDLGQGLARDVAAARHAVLDLARRLAGILYALLRDGSVFEP